MTGVRGRLAPLAVRPFGRLLSSYTINELGDSVGIVALAVLVYDRMGTNTTRAGQILVTSGFQDVSVIDGASAPTNIGISARWASTMFTMVLAEKTVPRNT